MTMKGMELWCLIHGIDLQECIFKCELITSIWFRYIRVFFKCVHMFNYNLT